MVGSPVSGSPAGYVFGVDSNLTQFLLQGVFDFLELLYLIGASFLHILNMPREILINEGDYVSVRILGFCGRIIEEVGFGPPGVGGVDPVSRRVLGRGVETELPLHSFIGGNND